MTIAAGRADIAVVPVVSLGIARRHLPLMPFVFVLVCLLLGLSAAVRPAHAERLPIKSYGPADGLPGTFIQHVTRDSRGFLWFSTRDGLSRFDGVRFVTYGFEHGLPNPTVNFLLESHDGVYWVATNGGGVCRLDPNAAAPTSTSASASPSSSPRSGGASRPLCHVYTMGADNLANRVNTLHEDRAGRIWAGTDTGVFRLDRDVDPAHASFRAIPMDNAVLEAKSAGVHTIVEDRDGTLWFGLGWGLYRIGADGRRTHFTIQPTLRGDNVYRVLLDAQDRLWLGHQTGVIILGSSHDRDGGTVTGPVPSRELLLGVAPHALPFDTPVALPSRAGEHAWYGISSRGFSPGITALARFPDGHLWLGSSTGLIEFDGDRFHRYTIAEGLSDTVVTSLASDADDNLWATTMAGGAMKLTRRGFTSYGVDDGLGDARVHAIFEDTHGTLMAVSGDWMLNRFDGQRFTHVQPRVGADLQYTWASQVGFLDRHDQWWLLTNKSVLRLPPGSDPRPLAGRPPIDDLADLVAAQIYEDRRGDLWFALRGGGRLAWWSRKTGELRRFGEADGLPSISPTALTEDREGHLWIGAHSGELFRYADGRFTRQVIGHGAAAAASRAPDGASITSLHVDDAGRLWAGSNLDGLIRIDTPESSAPRIMFYTRATGLGSNNVRSVVSDTYGRIYAGTARGIDRLDPDTGHIQHYTTIDGLPSGFVSAAYRDRHGDLWFATMSGLARLHPEAEARRAAPPVLIGGVAVAGTPIAIAHLGETSIDGLRLEPGQRQVQIDFFGLAFGMGEALRYRYRLEGIDREWSAPLDERTVRYSQLAPGRYRFLVRAVTADGIESARPASLSFTVVPAPWERTWVQALTAGVLLLAGVVAYRRRVDRLLALERVRTRIASDLHDDIGATLARIAVLSEVVQTKIDPVDPTHAPLRGPLTRIAQTSRDAIASMSDIVWAINPQKDSLHDMVLRMRELASEVLPPRGLTYSLEEAEQGVTLTADVRRQLYLIFKEAVNNVLKHAGATHVAIDLRIAQAGGPRRLRLRVVDNGAGFDPRAAADAGNGLGSMRRRAEALGGTFTVTSRAGETAIEVDVPMRSWRNRLRDRY